MEEQGAPPVRGAFVIDASDGVGAEVPLEAALEALRRSPHPALPILDPVTGEVVGFLSKPLPAGSPLPSGAERPWEAGPPRLGGMATPLGVYLTDGAVSGGAGFWGLFLAGVTLCVMALLAQGVTQEALRAVAHGLHRDLWAWIDSPRHAPALREWLAEIIAWLPLPLVFVFLRLLPMSGTHAAEHQVVHCVERRAPLAPDWVRTMPRVHPRCGTNLVVGFSLFTLTFLGAFCLAQADALPISTAATLSLVMAAPPSLLLWRRVGGFVQQWLATRPATDRQIAGAILAAQQVLARRARYAGSARLRPLRRVWSMGLLQVGLGYAAVLVPLNALAHHWPALRLALGL